MLILSRRDLRSDLRDQILAAAPGAELVVAVDREEFLAHLPQAEILYGALSRQNLDRAGRLRWVQADYAGVNHLPLGEFAARGIRLTNARGMHADTIADHVFGFLLSFSRHLPRFFEQQRERRWERRDAWELAGLTLGSVGYGAIGRAVARRAAAFGMKVWALKRHADRPDPGVERLLPPEGLNELLAHVDVVVVSLPLTGETRGLFDERAFQTMRPGSYFINVGRGELVDEQALLTALEKGHLAGAGLDVFQEEPLPPESPLWTAPGLLITPHMAGSQRDYQGKAVAIFCENLRRYVAGRPLVNEVDLRLGY